MQTSQLLSELQSRGWYLAIAESLTGGLLAAEFISVPGASNVVLGSITAYQNSLKQNLLHVPVNVLRSRGAVSAEVAQRMAEHVREVLAQSADIDFNQVVGISTTGVAGPDSSEGKPAGLVYLGISIPGRETVVRKLELTGDRASIRLAAVESAVGELWEQIHN